MIIRHTNIADKDGLIYCKKNNDLHKYTKKFRQENCLKDCEYRSKFPGVNKDMVECFWEDEMSQKDMLIKDPREEYRRLNKGRDPEGE